MGAAREKVRVARALAELPQLSEAMRRGALSYSKARALTRIATPENETSLADFARCATAAHVERLVRAWRRVDRIAAAEDEQLRHATRHLDPWVDEDAPIEAGQRAQLFRLLQGPDPHRGPAAGADAGARLGHRRSRRRPVRLSRLFPDTPRPGARGGRTRPAHGSRVRRHAADRARTAVARAFRPVWLAIVTRAQSGSAKT